MTSAEGLCPWSDSGPYAVEVLGRLTYSGGMRKLFWLLALLGIVWSVTGVVDRNAAKRRRELWAEATADGR